VLQALPAAYSAVRLPYDQGVIAPEVFIVIGAMAVHRQPRSGRRCDVPLSSDEGDVADPRHLLLKTAAFRVLTPGRRG